MVRLRALLIPYREPALTVLVVIEAIWLFVLSPLGQVHVLAPWVNDVMTALLVVVVLILCSGAGVAELAIVSATLLDVVATLLYRTSHSDATLIVDSLARLIFLFTVTAVVARAVDALEVRGEAEMLENAPPVVFVLRCRDEEAHSERAQGFECGGLRRCRRRGGGRESQFALRRGGGAQRVAFAFQFSQVATRLRRHGLRDAGEGGNLQPIALVRRTFPDAMQKYQFVAVFHRFDMHVDHSRRFGGEAGELEVVSGE